MAAAALAAAAAAAAACTRALWLPQVAAIPLRRLAPWSAPRRRAARHQRQAAPRTAAAMRACLMCWSARGSTAVGLMRRTRQAPAAVVPALLPPGAPPCCRLATVLATCPMQSGRSWRWRASRCASARCWWTRCRPRSTRGGRRSSAAGGGRCTRRPSVCTCRCATARTRSCRRRPMTRSRRRQRRRRRSTQRMSRRRRLSRRRARARGHAAWTATGCRARAGCGGAAAAPAQPALPAAGLTCPCWTAAPWRSGSWRSWRLRWRPSSWAGAGPTGSRPPMAGLWTSRCAPPRRRWTSSRTTWRSSTGTCCSSATPS
ncbi:MAG: hypothetical protein J3K34DRAFT_447020 [Monoraphidium minutum]|nr:MAG: hypothetical protein J3K34DRAFT_447020 [Monoraphidium minutum]